MNNFELTVNSKNMKEICDKLRFGGGESIAVGFTEDDETGKSQLMLLSSDGIVQVQGFIPVDIKGENEPLYLSSILLEDIKQISNYGNNIKLSFNDGGCRITNGSAKMSCPIMNNGKRIELPGEEIAEGLGITVNADELRHALNVGGAFGDTDTGNMGQQVYSKSVCFTFFKDDEDYAMRVCSSIASAFTAFSPCKISTDDATGEQLLQKQYVLKSSYLKSLMNCVDGEEIIIVFGKTHIWVKDDNAAYIITLLGGTFSNVILDLYENEQYELRFGVNRKELISAIDCVTTGQQGIDNDRTSIWLKIDGTKMSVESQNEEQKVGLEEFAIEEEGFFEYVYDSGYLKKLLLAFSGEKILMRTVQSSNVISRISKEKSSMMLYIIDNEKDMGILLPASKKPREEIKKLEEKSKNTAKNLKEIKSRILSKLKDVETAKCI